MTTFDVVVLPSAEEDISQAYAWYAERNLSVAADFRSRVGDAIDGLETMAGRLAERDDGCRHFVLRRFPYSVVFIVEETTAVVLALAHHKRLPGWWAH